MAPVSDVEVDMEVSSVSNRRALEECLCPVCLEILLEPVTLPCTHTFCKGCFLESVDKTSLCCPMCRKRVSTWARLNSRSNTLVNEQLWRQIQITFPQQCQRRLSGQDAVTEDDPGVSVCFPRVSEPGELRQEYQDQITKLTEEKRVLDEEERKASEEYIQRLLAEEEVLLQEERRRREDDERLARMLNQELNSASVSQENLRPADITPAKKKKVGVGQMEKFLCPLPSDCSSASSFMANKENILLSQGRLQAERPLPHLDYYGSQTLGSRLDERDGHTDSSEAPKLHPVSVEEQSPLRGGAGPSSAKRKSSELEATEEENEVMVTKKGCHSLPSTSSSSSSSSLEAGVSALQRIGAWESQLLSRRQQEEEDRQLALLLQKELDQEERQRATNRSKGSADAYLLRQSRRGKASSRQAPRRHPNTSCCSSPTSSSSSRGSKQATLTEMFSSLNS
ncbi:hypothetical protein PAMP_018089 [Pampus punctatissimus]